MSHHFMRTLTIALSLLISGCSDSPSSDQAETPVDAVPAAVESEVRPPVARVEAASDEYHGVEVEDPYRWLESWDNPDVKDWSEGQDAYARSVLAALPERPAVHDRISEILKSAKAVQYFAV